LTAGSVAVLCNEQYEMQIVVVDGWLLLNLSLIQKCQNHTNITIV